MQKLAGAVASLYSAHGHVTLKSSGAGSGARQVSHGAISGDTTSGYTIVYPDGSKDVYGFITKTSVGAFAKAFLTERWDPQAQKTFFAYTTNDAAPVVRHGSQPSRDLILSAAVRIAEHLNLGRVVSRQHGVEDVANRVAPEVGRDIADP